MEMRALALLALGIYLLVGGAHAGAEEAAEVEGPRAAHERTDANGDGQVDHQEYVHRIVDVFYLADGDRDGALVLVEYPRVRIGSFETSDLNGDGKVTLHEFLEATIVVFRAADVDDDGLLSVEEVVDFEEKD
jgi:hypothetical protein